MKTETNIIYYNKFIFTVAILVEIIVMNNYAETLQKTVV